MAVKPLSCVFGSVILPQQLILVAMLQLALMQAYHSRIVIKMVLKGTSTSKNYSANSCLEYTYEETTAKVIGPLASAKEIQLMHHGFYFPYIFSQIPGGWLADKIGARHVMGTCILLAAMITSMSPLLLDIIGIKATLTLEILQGIVQGPTFPAVSTFIQCWIPANQRGFLGAIAYGGSNIGVVTGKIGTLLLSNRFSSWRLPFYTWASFAFLWYMLWLLTVYSKPTTHPFITEEELHRLKDVVEKRKSFNVPWLKIAKSRPVWAILAGQLGHNYIFFTMVIELPKFLKEILKLDMQSTQIYTAVPFFLLYLGNFGFAYYADILVNTKVLSVLNVRKVCAIFSTMAPATILVLAVHVGCGRTLVILIYCIAVVMMGPFWSGAKVNVNDLTIHYGGTIMGIINGVGSITSILGPYVVESITMDGSVYPWRMIFWLMFVVATASSLIYSSYAEADRQFWDFRDDIIEEDK